jgi:hypothetical protein
VSIKAKWQLLAFLSREFRVNTLKKYSIKKFRKYCKEFVKMEFLKRD